MINRIYKISSAISTIIVIFLIVMIINMFIPIDKKGSGSVEFVLNHGNIITNQSYELVYGEQTPASFNGDHIDYYCLQIEKFEFQNKKENEWLYGPEENEIFKKARESVAGIGDIEKCFNGESDSNSKHIAAKIWSVETNRDFIEGAIVIMYHQPTNRVLYVSFQT